MNSICFFSSLHIVASTNIQAPNAWPKAEIRLCSWHVHKALSDKCDDRKETIDPATRVLKSSYWETTRFLARLKKELKEVNWNFVGTEHENLDYSWVSEMNNARYALYLEVCKVKHMSAADILKNTSSQPVCQNETSVSLIIEQLMLHLRWHPEKHLHPMERGDPSKTDVYTVWLRQVHQMTTKCRELHESMMWEYLWVYWYRPKRWVLWARASCPRMPVIQSNAPVESHFSVLKRLELSGKARPSLAVLCAILNESFLPDKLWLIGYFRIGRFQYPSSIALSAAWSDAQRKIRNEMKESGIRDVSVYLAGIRSRDQMEYKTDTSTWYCGCPAFERNAYHVCKHLVRALPLTFEPTPKEIHRQSISPILWIGSIHPPSSLEPLQTFNSNGTAVSEGQMQILDARLSRNADETRFREDVLERQFREVVADHHARWVCDMIDEETSEGRDSSEEPDSPSSMSLAGAPGEWLESESLIPAEEQEVIRVVEWKGEVAKRKAKLRELRGFLREWSNSIDLLLSLGDDNSRLLNTPSADIANSGHWKEWIEVNRSAMDEEF